MTCLSVPACPKATCWADSGRLHILLLLALPWALLFLGSDWIYSGLWHDPWIYLGHMLNFSGHMNAFAENYAASRLSVVLPGAVVYRLLPPLAANGLLHLGVYYLSGFSLYAAARELAGSRAAILAAVVFGTSFFVLSALGSDYVDAYIITYFLVATALLVVPTSRSTVAWMQVFAAGVAAFCMFNANIGSVILLPFLFLLLPLKTRGASSFWRGVMVAAALFLAGMLLAFLILSVIGYCTNGRPWLLQSQWSHLSSPLSTGNPFYKPIHGWISHAYWLLVPALMVLLFPLAALPRLQWASALAYLYLSSLLVSALILNRVWQSPMVQYWFYASWMLLPLAFIVLSLALRPSLERLREQTWSVLLAVSVAAGIIAAVWRPLPDLPVDAPTVFMVAAGMIIGCFVAPVPPVLRGLFVVLALCLSNMASAANFRMRHSYPERNASLADRWQQPGVDKADAFSAIVQTALLAKRVAPDSNAWFWFDMETPLGGVLNAAACTHWWGIRIINTQFPRIASPKDLASNPIKPGSRILALTENPATLEPMMFSQLQAAGIRVERLEQFRVRAGKVAFDVLVLSVLEVDQKASLDL